MVPESSPVAMANSRSLGKPFVLLSAVESDVPDSRISSAALLTAVEIESKDDTLAL